MFASKTFTLNNGIDIPAIGLGLWKVESETDCMRTIEAATNAGYRLIDTAAAYLNEIPVGKALAESALNREELFITTKLWVQDYGYENTKKAFKKSLERLRLQYLDMYLLHWAVGDYLGSWKALEELYKAGYIRAIGVCNFTIPDLKRLIEHATIMPVINQVETHPFYQQKEMKKFLYSNNIQHEAWAPLSQGNSGLFENDVLKGIALKHKKSVSQIILRWHLESQSIVIPKSSQSHHLQENFNIHDFELDDEDTKLIQTLDTNHPYSVDPENEDWLNYVRNWKLDI